MSAPEYESRFIVVLCRVEGSSNVGAVCRAMKTMGLSRLFFADCPFYEEPLVRERALSAFDVFMNASRFQTLAEALCACTASAGFTRRTGRTRTPRFAGVEDFARDAAAATPSALIGLVFGNERDGLTDEELRSCDLAVGIPTSSDFPSLNLSHAVQIAAWELRRAFLAPAERRPFVAGAYGEFDPPVARADAGKAAARIADRLQEAGFFKIAGRSDSEWLLSSVISRAGLSADELDRFSNLFTKLAALEKHKDSQ